MTRGRITFYRPDRRMILKEELPFADYNAALRYAQAMRRVHGWDIKDIRMLEEAGVKVHKYNREY